MVGDAHHPRHNNHHTNSIVLPASSWPDTASSWGETRMVKAINLTKGKVAIVDDDDYNEMNKYKWHAIKGRYTYYAYRDVWHPIEKRKERISMHRQILDILKFTGNNYTDHVNHNGLDNRKSNLRICTNSENSLNRRDRKRSGSIWWDKERKKWSAQICVNYKKITIGRFDSRKIAEHRMYVKAKSLIGDFAVPGHKGGDTNHG